MTQTELAETDIMFIQTQEILKLLDKRLFEKIPEKIKNYIVNYNSINNYTFTYDTSKRLKEQQISEDTRRLIAYFDYYYWASDEDKANIEKAWALNEAEQDSNEGINGLFTGKDVVHEAVIEMQNNLPHSSKPETLDYYDSYVSESSQEIVQEQPVAEPSQEVIQEQPVAEASQEVIQEQPVAEASQEVIQEQPVAEPFQEVIQEQPVAEPSQEVIQERPVAEASQEVIQEQPVVEPSQEITQESQVGNNSENAQLNQNTDIAVKKEGFFARLFRKLFKRSE